MLLTAQNNSHSAPKHDTYKLYDMGTFGGGSSIPSIFAVSATAAGVIGGAETALPDPFDPNCLFPRCCHAARQTFDGAPFSGTDKLCLVPN